MGTLYSGRYRSFYAENEDAYREKLFEHFGERSSAKLSIRQLIVLVKWMEYDLPDLPYMRDRSADATQRQVALLRTLWIEYARDESDEALLGFVYRVTKNRYLNIAVLRKADASKCIAALKKTLKVE